MKRSFKYLMAAGLLLALTIFSACSSGGAGNANSSNVSSVNSTVKNTNSANSSETANTNSAENKNTAPVATTADKLFTGDYSNYTGLVELEKKYKDRVLIVSEMYLWEITESEITASDSMLSGGNFIKCEGDFAEYMDSATRIKELRDKGVAVKGTVRGTVTDVREVAGMAGQAQITMNPCVLASLEK
jgi:hypothetical protein